MPVQATTFVSMTDAALAATAGAVVVGRVESVTAVGDADTGGVTRIVRIAPDTVVAGTLPDGVVELREPGGVLPDRAEHVLGAAEYTVGERVLVYLTRNRRGAWRTASLALGKQTVEIGADGRWNATRRLPAGSAVFDPGTRRLDHQPAPTSRPLEEVIADVHAGFRSRRMPVRELRMATEDPNGLSEYQAPFTLLAASRWFEADSGIPVAFSIDSTGEATLGGAVSQAAVEAAMAAWNAVPTSMLELTNGGAMAPQSFSGCGGPNRIVFNDPFGEIDDPSGCAGILAIGGFCTSGSTAPFNGMSFDHIVRGKVMFNNGWAACGLWSECTLAEVATHELGHAIGLGHSTHPGATMAPTAHFDGRCAGLGSDDIAGVSFIYGTPVRDSITQRRPGLTVAIPPGKSSVSKTIKVTARNADFVLRGAANSRPIRMVTRDGTCPPGSIGQPVFNPSVPGQPDTAMVTAGRTKVAQVTMTFDRDDVDTPNKKAGERCVFEIEAPMLEMDSADPTEANNVLRVPVVLFDRADDNGDPSRQIRDALIEPVAPLLITLSRNAPPKVRSVAFTIRNADLGTFPDHVANVAASDGDCPAGTTGAVDLLPDPGNQSTVNLAPGAKRRGKLTLTIDPAAFTSGGARSPARCTAEIGIAALEGETRLSNNSVPLVIDVIDRNDF
jgi:hypothetical protein